MHFVASARRLGGRVTDRKQCAVFVLPSLTSSSADAAELPTARNEPLRWLQSPVKVLLSGLLGIVSSRRQRLEAYMNADSFLAVPANMYANGNNIQFYTGYACFTICSNGMIGQ